MTPPYKDSEWISKYDTVLVTYTEHAEHSKKMMYDEPLPGNLLAIKLQDYHDSVDMIHTSYTELILWVCGVSLEVITTTS